MSRLGRWSRPKEYAYAPLSERDEQVRRDFRYRTGRWFFGRRGQYQMGTVLVCAAVALPLGIVLTALEGGEMPRGKELLAFVAMLAAGLFVVYTWWFYSRQDRSELRRSYWFSSIRPSDDLEVAAAKETLLSRDSSHGECERALELLVSRGACRAPSS
jgi:hypothetical protein